MNLRKLGKRKERGTVLITLTVSRGSNLNRVIQQLRKEWSSASNIKDKGTRRKVLSALKKLMATFSKIKVENGFIALGAYDGV